MLFFVQLSIQRVYIYTLKRAGQQKFWLQFLIKPMEKG